MRTVIVQYPGMCKSSQQHQERNTKVTKFLKRNIYIFRTCKNEKNLGRLVQKAVTTK